MKTCNRRRASAVRRLTLSAGVSLMALAAVATPRSAQAQGVVTCVNCSTMTTQLLQYAKDAQSLATQLQQYQTQLQQYTNMVTNTVAIPQEIWSTVQGDIMRVQALSNSASLLSGNAGSLIARLQNAQAYANQATSLANIPGQITGYQQTIGTNLSTMGKTLGLQQGQEASNAALLSALQQHSQSAAGQMQAIQAGNELAHQQATQLLQIQATLSGTAQMEATQMAVDADRRATNDAAMQHFAQPPSITTTGYEQW
jgi:type IV secretion system protein TrbJ